MESRDLSRLWGEQQLELLSNSDLACCCSEETNKFLRQAVSNDRFCLGLFRRAIGRRDDEAWAYIYQQYAPLVLTWVTQHQSTTLLLGQEGSAPLVNAAFDLESYGAKVGKRSESRRRRKLVRHEQGKKPGVRA